MAKSNAVWGIDIGQCALKALRLRPNESKDGQLVADAFDYVEYDKILSQPDAEPAELIAEALKTFLSRNSVKDDMVAISVSGQNGLARFIKLPPVEQKKIPDIVKYEAKQQIPFDLDDVIWDYQQLPGGSEEEGFALESEVGLFAMKRDQVFRALKPLTDAEIEVDVVQLAPLSIYNYVTYDLIHKQLEEEFDPEEPPESVVILSVGTDTTDLVVTNGFRVWQRSVPLGGNHFTKALSKDLKLTFGKAEHLKRNATKAEDPRALFKSMRPVFNDILSEIQTSIRFFQNVDKKASISKIICVGNAMKLPGLQRFLAQHLGIEVTDPGGFLRLSGPEVVGNPKFKENHLSFGVSYGLALQGLKESTLKTNLLPPEIYTERLIREKKPWAIASVAVLLLAMVLNFCVGDWRAWSNVQSSQYANAYKAVNAAKSKSTDLINEEKAKLTEFNKLKANVDQILSDVEGRYLWLEIIKAINTPLPTDPDHKGDIQDRKQVYITNLDYRRYEKKADWLNSALEGSTEKIRDKIATLNRELEDASSTPEEENPSEEDSEEPEEETDQENDQEPAEDTEAEKHSGMAIQLTGHHFNNKERETEGEASLRIAVMKKFKTLTIDLPVGTNKEVVTRSFADLGLEDIVVVKNDGITTVKNPIYEDIEFPEDDGKLGPKIDSVAHPRYVKKFTFYAQIWWRQIPHNERVEIIESIAKPKELK